MHVLCVTLCAPARASVHFPNLGFSCLQDSFLIKTVQTKSRSQKSQNRGWASIFTSSSSAPKFANYVPIFGSNGVISLRMHKFLAKIQKEFLGDSNFPRRGNTPSALFSAAHFIQHSPGLFEKRMITRLKPYSRGLVSYRRKYQVTFL